MTPPTQSVKQLQNEVFARITKNDLAELKMLLASNKLKINFVDENGMSPLQHVCYKGNKEIVQMLLDQGAEVNACQHEHGYTPLHFAALSGNAELCHLLMSYGAKVTATNSVGRTPAQMAAFVGNHNCVATINNYIPKADIDYYIKPQGFQTEPILPPYLAESIHKFIMQINVHPVRVSMTLQKCAGLMDNLPRVQKVLELMCQREMARGVGTNEIMAFKYHYLSCIVSEIIKCQKRQEARRAEKIDPEKDEDVNKEEKTKTDTVELFIRALLKCSKSDGIPEYQEAYLREVVREFPFRESTIFRQMVATLASTESSLAVSVIAAAINGQRGFADNFQICVTCGEEKATKKCSKCKAVQYCDRECQRLHWSFHKKECARVSAATATTANSKVADDDKKNIVDAVRNEIDNLYTK